MGVLLVLFCCIYYYLLFFIGRYIRVYISVTSDTLITVIAIVIDGFQEGTRKERFYLMTHSTHFI